MGTGLNPEHRKPCELWTGPSKVNPREDGGCPKSSLYSSCGGTVDHLLSLWSWGCVCWGCRGSGNPAPEILSPPDRVWTPGTSGLPLPLPSLHIRYTQTHTNTHTHTHTHTHTLGSLKESTAPLEMDSLQLPASLTLNLTGQCRLR